MLSLGCGVSKERLLAWTITHQQDIKIRIKVLQGGTPVQLLVNVVVNPEIAILKNLQGDAVFSTP